ncbi:MAG: ATP-binding protein, partial [Egibacteraceae bacterium]
MSNPGVGRAHSIAVVGLRAMDVTVEAHVGGGLPGFGVIGSSGAAAREAADRVRVALAAIDACPTTRKVLLSLAPADVPKAGARFDLAMAAAVLARLGIVPQEAVSTCGLLGELSLDARVRPVTGVLPSAARLAATGRRRLLVAEANAAEAALVEDLEVVPVADLAEVRGVLSGTQAARKVSASPSDHVARPALDMADVRGQVEARRALELAAAGGHHLLLIGPPGCGKSMLANRLPGILPPLSRTQALELAAIRSVAGLLGDGQTVLDRTPPFRAPHHTTSAAALLGGGSGVARPGELSLSHRCCFFMDELFAWSQPLLEALREPP